MGTARQRGLMNGRKKPGAKSLGVALDLTNVNPSIKDDPSITHAFRLGFHYGLTWVNLS